MCECAFICFVVISDLVCRLAPGVNLPSSELWPSGYESREVLDAVMDDSIFAGVGPVNDDVFVIC